MVLSVTNCLLLPLQPLRTTYTSVHKEYSINSFWMVRHSWDHPTESSYHLGDSQEKVKLHFFLLHLRTCTSLGHWETQFRQETYLYPSFPLGTFKWKIGQVKSKPRIIECKSPLRKQKEKGREGREDQTKLTSTVASTEIGYISGLVITH